MADRRERPSGDPANGAAMGEDVSPVELLFDLVFVYAISQLSVHLLENLDGRGAAETLVLLLAVFGVWSLISFGASLPGLKRPAVGVAVLVALLFGVFFNAGLTAAFGDDPWLFLAPFLVCNLGVVLFYLSTAADDLRRHGRSMLTWTVASTVPWLIGAFVSPDDRLWWWLAAAVIDVTGAWSAHPLPGRRLRTETIPFEPEHMIERSRLFLLIALGETILTTGTALSHAHIDVPTIVATTLAVIGIIALWGLYFAGSGRLISEHASRTEDPLRAARLAVNGLVVTAAGLIVVAVGYEVTIDEPLATAGPTLTALLCGGPLLYLGLQIWYLRRLTGHLSAPRLWGAAALVLAAGVIWMMPAVIALGVSSGVLAGLAVRIAVLARRIRDSGESVIETPAPEDAEDAASPAARD